MTDTPKKLVDGKLVALKGAELAEYRDMIANPPALPVIPAFTYKADIWRRCTDSEADKLEAALAASPTRMRRIFESATRIEHGDDDFPALKAGVEAALGAKRAVEILAPSET